MARNRNNFKGNSRRNRRNGNEDHDFLVVQQRHQSDRIKDDARVHLGKVEEGGATAFWYALSPGEKRTILDLRKQGQVQVRAGAMVEVNHQAAITAGLISQT